MTLFDDGWAEVWLFIAPETHCKSERAGLPIRPVIRVIVNEWNGPGRCYQFSEQDYRTQLEEPLDAQGGQVPDVYALFKYLRAKHNGAGCFREPNGGLSFILVMPDEPPWVDEARYYETANSTLNAMIEEVRGWFDEARKRFASDAPSAEKFHFPIKRDVAMTFDGRFVDIHLCIEREGSVASERVGLPVRPVLRVSVDLAQHPRHIYLHPGGRGAPRERAALVEPLEGEQDLYGLFKYLRKTHGGTGCDREPSGGLGFLLALPDEPPWVA